VVEADESRDATEVHVLDRWCYLGTATSEAEVAELLEVRRPRFDYDHYRILSRHLGKRGVRVVPLVA
jgi:DNA polymerase-3 subunit epsilon